MSAPQLRTEHRGTEAQRNVEILLPLHKAQTLTYLRMSGLKTALLINFNVEVVRQGIRRISL